MSDMTKPDTEVLNHAHEEWVLPAREPIVITDDTVAKIAQAVARTITELATAGKLKNLSPTKIKTETEAASDTLKPHNR